MSARFVVFDGASVGTHFGGTVSSPQIRDVTGTRRALTLGHVSLIASNPAIAGEDAATSVTRPEGY